MRGPAAGVRIAAILLALAGGAATAQQAGDNLVQLGYAHIATFDRSGAPRITVDPSLVTRLSGLRSPFDAPGISTSTGDADTAVFSALHFFTDHLALSLVGGIPARFSLRGRGVVRPTGATGALFSVDLGEDAGNPLARAKQWTPALVGQWYFRAPDATLRPFAGVGLAYTFFTEINLNPDFQTRVNRNFGRPLALAQGDLRPTHLTAYTSSSFQPIFNLGLSYRLSRHWGVSAVAAFALLHTNADLKLKSADDQVLADARLRIDGNPLALSASIGYDFGPGSALLEP